jgi:hypothetical protein
LVLAFLEKRTFLKFPIAQKNLAPIFQFSSRHIFEKLTARPLRGWPPLPARHCAKTTPGVGFFFLGKCGP